MMRNHTSHTADFETPEAQRVVALAKRVVAVTAVFVVLGLAVLAVRDAPRTDRPSAGETVAVQAAGSAPGSTAAGARPPGAGPVASDELHPALRFDPATVEPTVYY